MKTHLTLFFFLAIFSSGVSQRDKKNNTDLVFFDLCINSVIHPEFEIEDFPDKNYTLITVFVNRGDLIAQHIQSLETENDTIRIPRLLFAFTDKAQSLSKPWSTMYCNEIADGIKTEYYDNGKKHSEGIFDNGKPIEIKTYASNEIIVTQVFYKNKKLDLERINFFNETGDLDRYQLFKYHKKTITVTTYDSFNDTLIATEKQPRKQ